MPEIVSILKDFLQQSHSDNLKTSQYPKEFLDLRVKVSFGMGMPARVPWISFTTSNISTSNGYYPVYLYYKKDRKLVLAFGISETSEYIANWPLEIQHNYPKVKNKIENPARYGDSYVFKIYDIDFSQNKVSMRFDNSESSKALLNEHINEIAEIFKKSLDIEVNKAGSVISSGLFYMEQQLEDFLIENWTESELGKKYELIYEEGVLKSQQFQTPIGRIDILARDRNNQDFIVIELKRNQTSDDTIGQVLRYMGWVKENFKNNGVRGIIVAGKYDQKLHYASAMIDDVDVFIYEVQFSLRSHIK